jgi:predicted ribosome quality control (RQC) complex YloA/Tae2 family protein
VLTDWLIVRRLAAELDRALRGARIRDAGRIADGRFGLRVSRGTVAIDAFGPTPIVAIEGDYELERTAGWVRATAATLEGLRIDRVRARRGDRLIAIECSSRSRFGVESGYRLVAELVPRFGNVLLLKDDTIVSAAKEFARNENALRTIAVGELYQPPPLPGAPLAEPLEVAFAAIERGDDTRATGRASLALRAAVPLLPRLIADSIVAESVRALGASPGALAARARAKAATLLESTEGEPSGLGDVFAYRDAAGTLAQCHVVPLAQFPQLAESRAPELLDLLADLVGRATHDRSTQAFVARRDRLRARIEKRRSALAGERAALERERDDAESRDRLRTAGELLYAHLADVPPRAESFVPPSDPSVTIPLDPDLDAKANAAAIFKRYRKAVTKLDHVARRLADIDAELAFASELAWELERSEPETIDDVAEGADRLDRRKAAGPKAAPAKRKPIDVRVASDARIYVGRSPKGNADLTFRVAKPDDLWFHARETPGAHVVLKVDSARAATPGELERAAELAAHHSKARASDKVAVDYTERKYVRRQQNAPPGLVWYTNARTLVVAPRSEAPLGEAAR